MTTRKITIDDFKNDAAIKEMRSSIGGINNRDGAGFTPLCFAVLNGIAPEIIVKLANEYDASTSIKSKGKTPMQTACQAMNVDAVRALIGEVIEYIETDDNGNPKQAYKNCLPVYKKDEDGNDTNEPEPKIATTQMSASKRCAITDDDILAASLLSKEDILKAILEYKNTQLQLAKIRDSSNNNPLHLACIAQCYGSVDLLYKYRYTPDEYSGDDYDDEAVNSGTYDDHGVSYKRAVHAKNNDGKSPIDIAKDDSKDAALELKLREYAGETNLSLLLKDAFEKENHDLINELLLNRVGAVYIYEYYLESYNWGSPSGPLKSIIKYINEENNEDLCELLLRDYDGDIHFAQFRNNGYYYILAYLCYKKEQPLTTFNSIFTNGLSVAGYKSVVKIMVSNDWASMTDVCNITQAGIRSNCISAIFTSPFNSELFIKLVECNSNNKSSVIRSLYPSYFTFNNILSLIGYTSDENLFELVNTVCDITSSPITLTRILADVTDEDFRTGLIAYLYHNGRISLKNIDTGILDSNYKLTVLCELFSLGYLSITDIITASTTVLQNNTKCDLLSKLCEEDSSLINDIFEVAFSHSKDTIIDHVIQNIVTSDTIYDWYDKSYHYGSSSGPIKAVSQYINSEYNDTLFGELLVNKFNKDSHLATFIRLRCSNIVAFLLSNGNITLADICNTPEENTQSVINDLYDNNDISLQDLADLSETLGNEKLFDIFDAMIAAALVTLSDILSRISAGEFKDALLEHLHEEGTFNNAPVAVVAQSSFTASVGDVIELDASESYDPDGDPISYIWSGEHSDLLNDIHTSKPHFTVPSDLSSSIVYSLTVTVTDNQGAYDSASVTISVTVAENHAPIIVLADTFSGNPGNSIELDASSSYDPDGDTITFNWTGTYASLLDNPNSNKPRFTIPPTLSSTTTYILTLTVTDSHDISASKQITITAVVQQNQAPVVVINSTFEGQPGDLVILDASGSYDPENDPISFTWGGTYASQLNYSNQAKPVFTIPDNAVVGTVYEFTVRVTDNKGAYSSKSVTVRVPNVLGTLAFTTDTLAVETTIPAAAEQRYNDYRSRGLEIKENYTLIYDEDAIIKP